MHVQIPARFPWISIDSADFLEFLDFKLKIRAEGFTANKIAVVDFM